MIAALNSILDQQLLAGESFVLALEAERVALTGQDPDALEPILAQKEQHASRVEALDQDRRRFLAQHGFAPGREGMVAVIRKFEDPQFELGPRRAGPLATKWQRLVAVIDRCRADNARNGMIVTLQTQRVTKTLNILRTGRPDQLTYGRSGGQAAGATHRALGRV